MKKSPQPTIHVSVAEQRLRLKQGRRIVREYPVSTSKFGLGSEPGSMKTPLGKFRICERVGADAPVGTVFKSRVAVGLTSPTESGEDLVVSRILWLDGLQSENANTRGRYIYIHGTNHEDQIGQPVSHGCIRLRNADMVELFDLVSVGTPVSIDIKSGAATRRNKSRKSLHG